MLIKFRKAANNLFVRILLGLVALSFLIAGAAGFLGGNSAGNIVTFSKTDSISAEEFMAARAREIENIQRQNNINLTEEQITEMNLDKQVLQKLVNESMIKYLAKLYELDLSDEEVVGFIKQLPYFKDQDGNFDLKLFKEAFKNSKKLEDEYIMNLKNDLIKAALLDVFMNSFKPSKIMTDNIINYIATTKYFDLVTIDLSNKPAGFKIPVIEDAQAREFYKNSENRFIVSELRSFDYLVFDRDFFAKTIRVEESEIKSHYEENKNDFENKPYASVKKDVQTVIFNGKMEEEMSSLVKKLEEDIAAGMNLKDLSAKYKVRVLSLSAISKELLSSDENLALGDIADNLFEMSENEVSYPAELPEQGKIILTELKKITPSSKKEFAEVKDQITDILQKKAILDANMAILAEVQKTYDPVKTKPNTLKGKNITVKTNQSLSRADIEFESKISPELMNMIFKTAKGKATELVIDGNKGYFAFMRDEKVSPTIIKKISDTSMEQIITTLKESIIQEMIGHMTELNGMKVKM